jgi:hypothetical protein
MIFKTSTSLWALRAASGSTDQSSSAEGSASPDGAGTDASATDGAFSSAPDAVAAEGGGEAGASPTPPSETSKPKPVGKHWAEIRLGQEVDKRRKLEEQLAAQLSPVTGDENSLTEAEIERRVNERAAALAQAQAFETRCQEIVRQGEQEFGTDAFRQSASELVKLRGDSPAERRHYNEFLDALYETGQGARVLHQLGGDLNEAARILALTPARMAVALAKMALSEPPAPASKAPKPVTPIGSPSGTRERIPASDVERSDRLSTAEWMARREAEIKSRNAA